MEYIADFTMRDLLDAGVHFGHRKNYWNPKMSEYVYGVRNGIHVIDLQQTVPMLHHALNALKEVASKNGRILFVGTKRQASESVAENAARCGQYYVNHRWLGGMLTNWSTVSASIRTLQGYEKALADEDSILNKKERLDVDRKREKLDKVLGGIRNMGGKPDMLFVIDTNQEDLAIAEAKNLGIPVAAIVDTNSNPENIDYPIPGNDDARKAIALYCQLAADAILAGISEGLGGSGVDLGAAEEVPQEKAPKAKEKTEEKAGPKVVTKAEATAKSKEEPKPAKKAAEKKAEPKKAAAKKEPAKKAETKSSAKVAEVKPKADEKTPANEPAAAEKKEAASE